MRWLNRSLIALLGLGTLAVAAASAVLWLLGTEAGTGLLLSRLLERAVPVLAVGRVRGTLLGGLELENVSVRLAQDELDIARLTLNWNSSAALVGSLAFDRAEASAVAYRRLPATADSSPSAVLDLPFTIRLDAAAAESLTLDMNNETLVFGETRFVARYAGRRFEVEQVVTSLQNLALGGSGAVTFGPDGVDLAADVQWAGPVASTEAAGTFTVEGVWPALHLHHELDAPFPAVVDGELRFAGALRVDLAIDWQGLALPGIDWLASPTGSVALVGAVDSYTYDGRGTLDIDGRAADVTIRGAGEASLLLIEQVVLEPKGTSGAGAVAATGRVDLDLRQANLALTARDFDPGWIRADWPGGLTGTVGLRAELGPAAQVRFDALDMSGELRRYPVALRGAATFVAPDHWRLESLQLDSQTNLVLLDGTLERAGLDLAVTADVEQLGLLWPGAVGALTAEISVDGSWQEPHARGSMDARSLRLENVTFDRLTTDGEIGLAPAAPLALRVEAHGVTRGLVSADSVRATFAGTTGAQRIDVEAQAGEWLAKVAASGGLTAGVWRGSIDSFDVDEQLLGRWRLTEPAAASLGMSGGSLATSCLLHDSGARWCAELNVTGVPEDRLVVSAQNFALATLLPLLPPQLVVDGVYQLSASLFDLTGEPRGALALTGGATRAGVVFGAEHTFATEFDEVLASATLLESRLELQANVRSGAAGRVDLNARIDDIGARDSSIDGAVNVQWPDLAFLALLSPELSQVGGTLDVGLTIAGTVANPEVDGRAAWQGGRVAVPAWGLVVEGIEATATSDDGRSLTFDATGHAGDGELRLTGTTALDPQAGWPTRLNLRGESVQAVQLPNAQVYVTPNLDIVVALPDLRVTGTVHVPRAALELSELPAQAVVPSPDVVLHGVAVGDEVRPLRLQADIELTLGEDVRYAGLNLETLVSGRMRLNRDSNRSATATGTLTLAGTYNAYGQTLQLERGELLFSGPLDDPGLDVRAVRVIDETRVGIELAGTVKAPRTRVFSTPAMSEADALSYLLLGRPVTSSDGEETATLQTAAISMGLQQALPVVQRIGESLGFDEFTVQTTDTDAGALMAGKYLSPKIYIRYSYGLFNRIGGLLLRFKVNDRLSIETRSGDQKSMDLLYTVEKD